jgi:hypothetical protein
VTSAVNVVAAAFCPHPPLLVPAVGAAEPVSVRAAAVAAVQWLCDQPIDQLVLLGSAEDAKVFAQGGVGSFAGFGVDFAVRLPGATSASRLPLSLAVGAWLLAEVGWSGPVIAVTSDPRGALPDVATSGPVGLLVMGDGSARRTEKAPGWLDGRAAGYDQAVSAALAGGDPGALAVDLVLGAELLAAGAPAWAAAARLLAGQRWSARVSYDDAPYGVGYLVATWQLSAQEPAPAR